MKTKLILLTGLFQLFIFIQKANCQMADAYLINRGYYFPIECTIEKIDSIEKIRQSYKGVNDSLFLEYTLYLYEWTPFLDEEERTEFNYANFYQEILEINLGELNIEKRRSIHSDPQGLVVAFILAVMQIYPQLSCYYVDIGEFEKGYQLFLENNELVQNFNNYRINNRELYFTSDCTYKMFIGLNDEQLFVQTFWPEIWGYFFMQNSKDYQHRMLAFVEMIKANRTAQERQDLLNTLTSSINFRKEGSDGYLIFLGEKVSFGSGNIIGFPKEGNKQDKETFLKNYLQGTEFYKLLEE